MKRFPSRCDRRKREHCAGHHKNQSEIIRAAGPSALKQICPANGQRNRANSGSENKFLRPIRCAQAIQLKTS